MVLVREARKSIVHMMENVKHNNRVKEIEDVERAEEEEIMQPQNARVQEGCDIAKEKYKEASWALEEKKFQALSNTPIGAATVDTSTTTLLVPNVDYIAETGKNNYKQLDGLDVMISDVANNNKERVECISADLMSEVANTNETTKEKNISNAERSERSSAYKEPIIDELVKLGDEIQKSVDLAQELLIKLEEKLRQRKLKDKELARRKSEEDAFAADKKKWQSPSEDQLSVASSSTKDMDGRIMSQTFSPIIVEKQISQVTKDTDDPEVTEPSNSEKL
ncbi:hypothetical protein KGM_212242 [Danaus plexippus plexippus]|uniref:Uncharacterized protein n=1 Tax=Danaus plexippus plexippus TaxID=278856 RepID=A0A212EX30_DANPL|nr:hypothetical protein KGM_212242 [Danaus plexippus plexippus]